MIFYRILLLVASFSFSVIFCGANGHYFEVRALLDELSNSSKSHKEELNIAIPGGACIIDASKSAVGVDFSDDAFSVVFDGASFFINTKKVALSAVRIVPKKGIFVYQGNEYPGACILAVHEGSLYCINAVNLEEYVACVVQAESWPTWDLEYLKTQAVVTRTYAARKIFEARELKKKKSLFDIRCTNKHQTYKGGSVRSTVQKAVDETSGEVIVYKGEPIEALYDTCCYRKPTKGRVGVHLHKAPYLERSYACTLCEHAKCANWTASFSLHEFNQLISEYYKKNLKATDIKITRRDESGLVHEIKIKTRRGWISIRAKELYAFAKKKIKSLCFSVTKKGSEFVFEGQGYGHGLGLCQWGAEHAARVLHWDYRRIVQFYYTKDIAFKCIAVEQ